MHFLKYILQLIVLIPIAKLNDWVGLAIQFFNGQLFNFWSPSITEYLVTVLSALFFHKLSTKVLPVVLESLVLLFFPVDPAAQSKE